MERYTLLTNYAKKQRRQQRLANFSYARYADDFVVLCNGTKEQAEQMKCNLTEFLRSELRLTLSDEKTKVTHLNDGFDFLGFTLRRYVGETGAITKILISARSIRKHWQTICAATDKSTHKDSFATKFIALNRIITGWCNYYRYTSRANTQFKKVSSRTFWRVAHWLARRNQLSIPATLRRFGIGTSLGIGTLKLQLHEEFKTQRYHKRFRKPNPYTMQEVLHREELPTEIKWRGCEKRPGWLDLRDQVYQRDGGRCRLCGEPVSKAQAAVDHRRPMRHFRKPVDSNQLDNLWLLCGPCHKQKTELDRRMESRMQ
jgi:RNA-directed DNA polymerase